MKKTIIFLLAVLMLGMASCADSKSDSSEDASSEVIYGIDRTYMIIYGEITEVHGDYDVTVKVYDDNGYGYNGRNIRVEYSRLKDEECFELVKPEIGMKMEIAYRDENIVEEGDNFSIVYDHLRYHEDSDGTRSDYLTYVKFI
ncbi:MAG: hypothetical protein ACI4JA_07890 [Oscillospiraceae bacterium]